MGINLADRVAIITGGGNGIGLATALQFARAGAAVALWDVGEQAGHAAQEEITRADGRAFFQKVNVANESEVEAAVAATLKEFGRIDILVNNAGICRDSQLVKVKNGEVVGRLSDAQWAAVIGVNLTGVYYCTQAVAPTMIRQRYGRIITASSVVGQYGNFGQTNYAATKAGVIGMTKVWARELGKYGITANAIAPGFIKTDMTGNMPEKVPEQMVEHTPANRIGLPQDVANGYLFLASEEASFINGTVLNIDGGLVLGT
ncbi:MAG: beta-ketoacyl-ACP reductase [Herpetosiphon sp.]